MTYIYLYYFQNISAISVKLKLFEVAMLGKDFFKDNMTSMKSRSGYFVCTFGLYIEYITAAVLAVVFAILQNFYGQFENENNLLL